VDVWGWGLDENPVACKVNASKQTMYHYQFHDRNFKFSYTTQIKFLIENIKLILKKFKWQLYQFWIIQYILWEFEYDIKLNLISIKLKEIQDF